MAQTHVIFFKILEDETGRVRLDIKQAKNVRMAEMISGDDSPLSVRSVIVYSVSSTHVNI